MIDARDWKHDESAARDCISLNRAFHAWGHKFLYNQAMLTELLRRAGFGKVEPVEYGESTHDALRGLERHERYPDSPSLRHVLIVEASTRCDTTRTQSLDPLLDEYRRDINAR